MLCDDHAVTTGQRQERAIRTREQILDGAVAALVEFGYAGLTMARVQQAAGVSRGALTHHFGSMTEIAVAAIDHVADIQGAEIEQAIADGPLVDAVDVIHEITRRPTYIAGLQLWVAARTEPQLRDALRPGARRLSHQLRGVLAARVGDLSDERLDVFVDGLLSLLRGLAIGGVLRDRPDREKAVLTEWLTAFS